jgi:prevent-host-death family protein
MKATAKDLRFNSKGLLDTVNRGEEVIITYRGKPCAKLVPYDKTDTIESMVKDEFFGIWKDNNEINDINEYVKEIRKGRY